MQLTIWREADSKRMFFSNMQSGWLHCILAVGLPACSRMLQVTRFNRNSKAKISGDFLGDFFFRVIATVTDPRVMGGYGAGICRGPSVLKVARTIFL